MEKSKAMKWVKALRSGKYKQGKSTLVDYESPKLTRYCCLGVLCDISGIIEEQFSHLCQLEENLNSKVGILNEEGMPFTENSIFDSTYVRYPIKLKVRGKYYAFDTLAEANDKGASFKVIATWIEKNYRKL